MSEMKSTLKRMAVYYLLLAIIVLFNANIIPDVFPTRNLSTIYLLVLSMGLVLYYAHRVSPTGGLSAMMKLLSWTGLLLILLRGVKYSALSEVEILARHTWYLYYVPFLLLPLFLFCISLLVSSKDSAHIPKAWYWSLALTLCLIVMVLTNDWHQQVFAFLPDFVRWDSEYTYRWLFYVITVWQFALFLASIIILVFKCRIGSSQKSAWVILIPMATGVVMYVLLFVGKMPMLKGAPIIEVPEAHLFTAAIVLECCMQLGLIPTNNDYGKLFRNLSIAAQITDRKGAPVYSSSSATPLTAQQFALPGGARIAEHTVLHKMVIPGGYGFWQDDMTELDRVNAELAEAKERLAEETELIRLRNELKEKQAKIEQRTQMYDAIARRTQRQSQAISQLAVEARQSTDPVLKDACRRRITLLGAYIKRFANLMLLSEVSDLIEGGELGLSVMEVLRYLNYCGVPGECISNADCFVSAAAALYVFETFQTILETNYCYLQGVFVNLTAKENVTFKSTCENMVVPLSPQVAEQAAAVGVQYQVECEDNVTYICFILPKGGAQV